VWEKQHDRSARELLRHLAHDAQRGEALGSLAQGAIRFRNGRWLPPLWDIFDVLDRKERLRRDQPLQPIRSNSLLHHIAKHLPPRSCEARIAGDANRARSFSFQDFQNRWSLVHRPWPPAATRGILHRLRELPTRTDAIASKWELYAVLRTFDLVARM